MQNVRMPVPCTKMARLSTPQFTRVIAPLMTAKAFPCSVSSLWRFALHHHPSPLSLRQVNNGDRHLEVGAGSALETWASPPWSTIRTHSPRSGYRQARPCPGIPCEDSNLDEGHDPSGQKVSATSEHGTDPPARAKARGGTFIDGHWTRAPNALPPAQV